MDNWINIKECFPPEWINIQDRMPPPGLPVLCCYTYGDTLVRFTEICYWSKGTSSWFSQWDGPIDLNITHWMYLPELPNE